MDIDHGLAAVELLQHRHERLVAEILAVVAGPERDAVGLERVVGVFDLLQAALDVDRRDRREDAEAVRVVAAQLGGVVVALAREPPRGLLDLAVPGARIEDRGDRVGDAGLVHVVERHLHRPGRAAFAALALDVHLALRRRDDVVVDVDAVRLSGGLRRRRAKARRAKPGHAKPDGGAAGEEAAPAHGGARKAGGRLAADAAAQEASCACKSWSWPSLPGVFLTAAMVDAAVARGQVPAPRMRAAESERHADAAHARITRTSIASSTFRIALCVHASRRTLQCRIFLTPGPHALFGDLPLSSVLHADCVGRHSLSVAPSWHSGWDHWLGRTAMRQNALLRSDKGLEVPSTARKKDTKLPRSRSSSRSTRRPSRPFCRPQGRALRRRASDRRSARRHRVSTTST